MWIAKNRITGKTYGQEYNSIYDCQKYIDTNLVILQYEWRRIETLEEKTLQETKFEEWFKNKYPNESRIEIETYARIQFAVEQFSEEFPNLKNNVILCYNTYQERYADGYDF